jgi:hypothetical protein
MLSWLIFDSACALLAAENGISLESILVEQPLLVNVTLAFHCDVKQFKSGSLPEIVARIYKLVGSSIETSLN